MLQNALGKGAAEQASFRSQVYKAAKTALLHKLAKGENPTDSQRLLRELEASIDQIESQYMELDLRELSVVNSQTIQGEAVLTISAATQGITTMPVRRMKIAGISALALIAVITLVMLVSDNSPKELSGGTNLPAEPADISFLVGNKVRDDGNAKTIEAAGVLFIIDESEKVDQFHQWIFDGIKSGREHSVRVEWGNEASAGSFLQLQIIYSAKGEQSNHYIYVIDLASGQVYPKGKLAIPDFQMANINDKWMFETVTKTLNVTSKMQFIISPTIGKVKTGSVYVRKISVSAKSAL